MPRAPKQTLPIEFKRALQQWRDADKDVRKALAYLKTAPGPVSRTAVLMAWAASKVPLDILATWPEEHPAATEAMIWAYASSESLRADITGLFGLDTTILECAD
jgi:hypothetical protein